ncbi:MAG: hypothetical protein R2867_18880 [Caldilineaceae bacterium]
MSKQIKRYARVALPVIIVIALIIGVVKYVNGADVLNALRRFNYTYAPLMLTLSTLYLLVISWRFVVLLRPLSDVQWHVPFKSFIASQPGLLIPGGLALRAGLLKQAGVAVGKGSVTCPAIDATRSGVFLAISLIAALWFPQRACPL